MKFADGRIAVWTDALEPIFYDSEQSLAAQPPRANAERAVSNLKLLHASVNAGTTLESSWTDWRVEVHEREYRVIAPDGRGFTAERHGAWIYVAWEAPKAFVPLGRLWVSDESGLRAYLPDRGNLIVLDE